MDLIRVETELKKRWQHPYRWGRKQSNDWDAKTNFIYHIYNFEKLVEISQKFDSALKDYAYNRWYNFWSAMAVENIFANHALVTANKNRYDKLVDFQIDKVPFDHKTSIFPQGYSHKFGYAINNKPELIRWLYESQSKEQREHYHNRLFLVLYDEINLEHWKLKAEISILQKAIDSYIEHFSLRNLVQLNFGSSQTVSDIIWITHNL